MKKIITYILLILLVYSCTPSKPYDALQVRYSRQVTYISNLESQLGMLQNENMALIEQLHAAQYSQLDKFSYAKELQFEEFINGETSSDNEIQVEKSEEFEFLNGKLPKTFYEREFYKGLSATTYDLFALPGKIVKKTGGSTYQILTPIQLIESGTVLDFDYIDSGLLFKDYLAKGMSANGSYVIGSFEAKTDQIIEITLTDVLKSFTKPETLDTERLKKYQKEIQEKDDSDKYFFIQSATLTIGTGRIFNSSRFKKNVNATIYLTAKGDVYKTNEQIKNERIITVELISLKDMLL